MILSKKGKRRDEKRSTHRRKKRDQHGKRQSRRSNDGTLTGGKSKREKGATKYCRPLGRNVPPFIFGKKR